MVIGVTGGYCSGKTTVVKLFKKYKARIVDLDKLAHKSLNPKSKNFKKIIKEFGKDILSNGKISHLRLARKVFGDKKRLAKLNSIIHPAVIKQMASLIRKHKKRYRFIVVEAPLLFEADLKDHFDYIVVVSANKKKQIERAIKKTRFDKADILKRIKSQIPLSKKGAQADFVVDNNKSLRETKRQVNNIIREIKNNLDR